MKKKTAWVLFGGLAVLSAGWVSWCARPFVEVPRLSIDPSIDGEGKRCILEWLDSNPQYGVRDFHYEAFVAYLAAPWTVEVRPIYVESSDDVILMYCGNDGRFYSGADQIVMFDKNNGKWELTLVD